MPTIKQIQERLIELGYKPGPADNILGRLTIAAIALYQSDKNLDIRYPGTIGPKTLKALGFSDEENDMTPPWVLELKRKLGLHENLDNKELREYLKSDGQTLGDPAKLPWCGDLIETVIALTLPNEPMIGNPYWARNWLKFGVSIAISQPVMGAIGVVERGTGGHVFIIVGHDMNFWHAAGGNQSNSISIVKIKKSRTLGVRFPITYPMPKHVLPFTTFNGKISVNEA